MAGTREAGDRAHADGVVPAEDDRGRATPRDLRDDRRELLRGAHDLLRVMGLRRAAEREERIAQLRVPDLAPEDVVRRAERELARALGELAHGAAFATGWNSARITPSAASS